MACGPILTELRPRQWAKNLLVVAAPAGAEVLTELEHLVAPHARVRLVLRRVRAPIYVLNDLADIEADRRHPTKRNRPIAAGLVSVGTARVVAAVLAVIAFALAIATTEWDFVAVLALVRGDHGRLQRSG